MTVNADGLTTYWCPFCGGVAHPATGCEYRPGYVVCLRCTKEGWRFIKGWTRGRRRGFDFYGAATRWMGET